MAHLNFHESGPLPLATSWIFQINFINIFALCGFCVFNFSTSRLLVSHSLSSYCSLVPLCYVFTWKPLALMSIFFWSFNCNIAKPGTRIVGSSMVFDHCTFEQATQTQCSRSGQSCGFESVVWLWIWSWEDLCWLSKQSAECGWNALSSCVASQLVVASSSCWCEPPNILFILGVTVGSIRR